MSTSLREADIARFTVTYDGPEVASGRMDAQTLGAAMLSIAQLIDAGAGLTYGAGIRIETEIAADFRQGSFSFVVVVGAELATVAQRLLQTLTVKDLLEALGIIGGGGAIAFIRWLRDRKIRAVEPATTPGESVVWTEDGDVTQVNSQTVVLFQNSTIRLHLDGVVAPLKRDGITELRSGQEGAPLTQVTQQEVAYFEPPPLKGETLQDKISREIVEIVSANFDSGRKWRFRLVDGTAFNSALDPEYAMKVARREELFGAGDAFEADVRTHVMRDENGDLRATREIAKVVRRIPAPKLQLDLLEADGATDG